MHLHNDAVTENTEIIDHNDNWAHLHHCFYYIKTRLPEINIRPKVSKELQLFKWFPWLYYILDS